MLKNGCITIDEYKATIENGEVTTVEKGKCEKPKPICIRATELHTEECNETDSTYYCSGAGYTLEGSKKTTIITYGNKQEKIIEGRLQSGDAFDCDVNGDGKYNSETERFYYVSDLYDTTKKEFNDKYAVFIYYNDTLNGNPNNTITVAYDSTHGENVNENWHGPLTAIMYLPTTGPTGEWNNVSLSNNTRAIISESKDNPLTTQGGTLSANFNYIKDDVPLAARLLTTQELEAGCGIIVGPYTTGELDGCNYMLENSSFSNRNFKTYGYWLENPISNSPYHAWYIAADRRGVNGSTVSTSDIRVLRPVIEVLKTDIDY